MSCYECAGNNKLLLEEILWVVFSSQIEQKKKREHFNAKHCLKSDTVLCISIWKSATDDQVQFDFHTILLLYYYFLSTEVCKAPLKIKGQTYNE